MIAAITRLGHQLYPELGALVITVGLAVAAREMIGIWKKN